VLCLPALLSLALMPAAAAAGYDIAHIIERTCDAGGPLIVTEEWKRKRDRGRQITEPGEVIGCRPVGAEGGFQMAAGSERIGDRAYLCTYFSLFGRDGADICLESRSVGDSHVRPLIVLRTSRSGPVAVAGVAGPDVDEVALASSDSDTTGVTPMARRRAVRVGASRAFGYFSLAADPGVVCADGPPRLIGLDDAGRRFSGGAVRRSTRLLDGTDRVPHSRALAGLCSAPTGSERGTPSWLAGMHGAMRSVLEAIV
jgi:hypothetical protein